jgi:hypothetical protein
MRRVMISGIWGALPGAAIIGIAALLHSMNVITSDQSQIAFIGVPLLALGLPIGLLSGAAAAGSSQAVLSGMGVGLAAGVALAMALTASFPGAWLVVVPAFMMAGAMVGAWRHDHRAPPPPLAQP